MEVHLTARQLQLIHGAVLRGYQDAKNSANVMRRVGDRSSAERNRMLADEYAAIANLILAAAQEANV